MKNDYESSTGKYLTEEIKRHRPEDKTGYYQEIIEGKIEQEFQRRDFEQSVEHSNINTKVEQLTLQVKTLTQILETITKQEEIEDVIEVRNIPIKTIKEEMLSLLSDGKMKWAGEIAEQLNLDIKDVVEAFKQLQKEGKLSIDDKI